ncbi:hypothetical protein CC79DRAFT_1328138 [Sarocladium strictum]
MAPTTTTSQACLICEQPNSKLCAVCKGSAYCSKECQKKDWKIHKLLCADFAALDLSKRPSADHFRGILLPENDEKPTCVWMKYTPDVLGYVLVQHIDLETGVVNFGNDSMHRSAHIFEDKILGRKLTTLTSLHHRENFLGDGSSFNKAIRRIDSLKANKPAFWRGPVVIVGINEVQQQHWKSKRRDATMKDFRYAADYFLTYKPTPDASSFWPPFM